MSTVSKSFTSAIAGGGLFVRNRDRFSYDISGTFVATLGLEFTVDGGLSWERVATFTGIASGYVLVETKNSAAATYRFRAYSYTSGTAVTTLTEQDSPVTKEFRNAAGDVVGSITERGINVGEIVAPEITALGVQQIDRFYESPTDKVYTLMESAKFAGTIKELTYSTLSGTATAVVKIGTTAVTGLSALAVSSVQATTAATAANTFAVGDKITLTLSASSTPADMGISLKYTR